MRLVSHHINRFSRSVYLFPWRETLLLGRSREVFFLFFSFCAIIHREIRHVEETHATLDLPLLDRRADPHRSDTSVGAEAEIGTTVSSWIVAAVVSTFVIRFGRSGSHVSRSWTL